MKDALRRVLEWIFGSFVSVPEIPQDVLELITSIHSRYSQLDLNGGSFIGLTESQKLEMLIKYINDDSDLLRLNQRSCLGCLIVFWQHPGRSYSAGLYLCFDGRGLFISHSNDYEREWRDTPLTSVEVLDQMEMGIRLSCERLRAAIADYTERRNYIQRVVNYKKEFLEIA